MRAPFEPGDVVVCVDDRACLCGCGDPSYLARGRFYRLKSVYWDPFNRHWGCTQHGVPDYTANHRLAGISTNRFRKIDDEQIPEVLERLKSLGKQRERIGLNPARHEAYRRVVA